MWPFVTSQLFASQTNKSLVAVPPVARRQLVWALTGADGVNEPSVQEVALYDITSFEQNK